MTLRVLLVDGARLTLDLEATWLRQTNAAISTAVTGSDALALLGHETFGLCVLDAVLPDMDGLECCRAIRDDARLAGMPIVVVGEPGRRGAAAAAGADGFLPKPISRGEFLQEARRLTDLRVREHPRVPVHLRVRFRHANESWTVWSKNLSRGGIFLRTGAAIPRGARVSMEFELPLEDGVRPFRITGEVIQTADPPPESGRGAGIGIRFLDLMDRDRALLDAFLARLGY